MNSMLIALIALAVLVTAGTAIGAGDPARGEKIYLRCMACHALNRNRTGPKHCGLIGRNAGQITGFEYSDAMRNAGIVWTKRSLDRFLRNPVAMIPETTMGYDGVKDKGDRADLIAYLATAICAD